MNADAKKPNGKRSIEERKAAVAKFLSDTPAVDVAEQHGVSTATIYQWARDFKEGKLIDPDELAARKAEANGEARRKQYTEELREKVIAAYYAQRGTRAVADIGADFGVSAHSVHQWVTRAKKNGTASAIVKRSEAAIEVQPARQLSLLAESARGPRASRDHRKIQALALAVRALTEALLEDA